MIKQVPCGKCVGIYCDMCIDEKGNFTAFFDKEKLENITRKTDNCL